MDEAQDTASEAQDEPIEKEAPLDGEPIPGEEVAKHALFADFKASWLKKTPDAVVRRTFEPGEVICRQGEGGNTAFYIIEGACRIFIDRPTAERPRRSLVARIGAVFGQKTQRIVRKHAPDQAIPVDATVDLRYGELAAKLGPGDLFGESSCLNYLPRSATVVAESPCALIEIRRHIFLRIADTKAYGARMEAIYRERTLTNHLRNTAYLRDLPDDAIEGLKQAAELITLPAGAVVFQEGDDSDGMYFIRRGQIKVSKRFATGERPLSYLFPGDCFGEIGLLEGVTRTATCAAADQPLKLDGGRKSKPVHVELVKIKSEDFKRIVEPHPEVMERLRRAAGERREATKRAETSVEPVALSERVQELGLLQGQNLMIIDLEKCTRCDQCAEACVAAHDDGVSRLVREGPRFDKFLVPAACRMCHDPVCMVGCPVASIRKGRDMNIVIEDWCIGCENCANQCPYNSIQMYVKEPEGPRPEENGKKKTREELQAVVCDQCSTLPTGPACVYACPHDAAKRVDGYDFLTTGRVNPNARPSRKAIEERIAGLAEAVRE